jgi:hypothetical protein
MRNQLCSAGNRHWWNSDRYRQRGPGRLAQVVKLVDNVVGLNQRSQLAFSNAWTRPSSVQPNRPSRLSRQSTGKASSPWRAPTAAPTMAATVSLGDAQALGQQHVQGLADAIVPMAQAGAFMGQFVLKEFLASKILEIGIMHPAIPNLFVR